ncbi:hypothetical protein [Neptuniibacter sp. QD37_11]|uniref:hypothetical protein n=1 Tax=Neptuniibacter sp. QD37_11 TaxID=3398209 RepID=UPI0039F4B4EF
MFVVAGSGYFNYDKMASYEHESQFSNAITQLTSGYRMYENLHEVPPDTLTDMTTALIDEPKLPQGMTVTYDESNKNYFCFDGSVNESVFMALDRMRSNLGETVFSLSDACGDNTSPIASPSFPVALKATYYITK